MFNFMKKFLFPLNMRKKTDINERDIYMASVLFEDGSYGEGSFKTFFAAGAAIFSHEKAIEWAGIYIIKGDEKTLLYVLTPNKD